MLYKLKKIIGPTARIIEDYGGYEITVIDAKKFPWADVLTLLLDSGFQVWINKTNSHLCFMAKPEVN